MTAEQAGANHIDAFHYDRLIGQVVPGYDALLAAILDHIPQEAGRILDLGCGTGNLCALLKKRHPDAEIFAIDISAEMIAVATCKPQTRGVHFLRQDLRAPWPERRFDAIITCLTLHHLGREERIVVAARAAEALKRGGRFLCADIFAPESAWEAEMAREVWHRRMCSSRVPPRVIQGMLAQWDENHHTFTTPGWFRDRLLESGFSRAAIPYHAGISALVIGFC